MNDSTIHVSKATKLRLEAMKEAGGMTYDKLIRALLSLVPEGDEEGKYTEVFKASFLGSSLDVAEGKVVSLDKLKRSLDLD